MSEIRSYKDLVVWQKSINLVRLVYDFTAEFPDTVLCGLTFQ